MSEDICPFDLNVLCTPPAFILSQDQTLDSLYIKLFSLLSFIEYLLFPFDALLLFCKSLFFSLELTRHFFNFSVLFVLSFPICCSIFKDRFALALRECLNNISHLFPFVNTFFQIFSIFLNIFSLCVFICLSLIF